MKYRIIAFQQNTAAKKIQKKWQRYATTRSERAIRERKEAMRKVYENLARLTIKEAI